MKTSVYKGLDRWAEVRLSGRALAGHVQEPGFAPQNQKNVKRYDLSAVAVFPAAEIPGMESNELKQHLP